MRTIPKQLIKAMPYDERLRRFHAEKNGVIREDPARPAQELDAITKQLAKKWQV